MVQKIQASFIIQIAGKPAENVDKALDLTLDKLSKDTNFKLLNSEKEEVQFEEESKLYSGFLDVEAKFEDSSKILGFILDYTPTSIEVLEPESISLDAVDFTGLLNDFSRNILGLQSQVRILNANMHHLIKKYNIPIKKK